MQLNNCGRGIYDTSGHVQQIKSQP